ncbi:endoplasmic reticulum oxidoreductin 1, partial [Dimargaris cristalligena]
SGAIDDLRCEFHAVESVNDLISPTLKQIVDLYKQCAFWANDGLCVLKDCVVQTEDEETIPIEWRTNNKPIDKVDFAPFGKSFQPFQACDYEEKDFCVSQDEQSTNGVYVDLLKNPERFTGYAGQSAQNIWQSIYEENCFDIPARLSNLAMSEKERPHFGNSEEEKQKRLAQIDECKEKRVFYRVVSGLHASISTHLCYDYFNRTTQEWSPNLECFMNRVGYFPERLQNIYFNYALLLRSILKLNTYLLDNTYCVGNSEEEIWLKSKIQELVSVCLTMPNTFDESELFDGPNSIILKEEVKDRFRNVSRIMDCVGCEKCRLWGKLQTRGFGTALKVLFSYDQSSFQSSSDDSLDRGEIVSLLNTFNQFSKSINVVQKFHHMYHDQYHSVF